MADDRDVRARTYNYLRLAMMAVIAGLFVALTIEWVQSSGCFQTSISAYYYTPVRSVFVGALLAMSVAMIAIWGRSSVDDAFMNLAGLFAPVVAFVPTASANRCSVVTTTGAELDKGAVAPEQPAPSVVEGARAAIDNNMGAFFILVAASLIAMVLLRRRSVLSQKPEEKIPYLLSYAFAVLFWVVGVVTFLWMRDSFYDHGHGWSATLLFICVIVVVFESARQRALKGLRQRTGRQDSGELPWTTQIGLASRDRYAFLGFLMIAAIIVIKGFALVTGWDYEVLLLEGTLIGLFLLFWLMQTTEFWYSEKEGTAAVAGSAPDHTAGATPGMADTPVP